MLREHPATDSQVGHHGLPEPTAISRRAAETVRQARLQGQPVSGDALLQGALGGDEEPRLRPERLCPRRATRTCAVHECPHPRIDGTTFCLRHWEIRWWAKTPEQRARQERRWRAQRRRAEAAERAARRAASRVADATIGRRKRRAARGALTEQNTWRPSVQPTPAVCASAHVRPACRSSEPTSGGSTRGWRRELRMQNDLQCADKKCLYRETHSSPPCGPRGNPGAGHSPIHSSVRTYTPRPGWQGGTNGLAHARLSAPYQRAQVLL